MKRALGIVGLLLLVPAAGLEFLKWEDREVSSYPATAMEYAGSVGGRDLHRIAKWRCP